MLTASGSVDQESEKSDRGADQAGSGLTLLESGGGFRAEPMPQGQEALEETFGLQQDRGRVRFHAVFGYGALR